MTEYHPNKWVVLDFGNHYRVFGSWSGSYTTGDSWRCNSGVTKAEQDGEYFLFHGSSGSVYKCHKDMYGIAGVYNLGVIGDRKILPEETDWLNFDWKIESHKDQNGTK